MTGPTALQLVTAAGALIGLGVALALWRMVPAQPDLRDALERLSPEHGRRLATTTITDGGDATDRLGRWGMKVLPAGVWGPVPTRELAILRTPVSQVDG